MDLKTSELVTDCGSLSAKTWNHDNEGSKRVLLLHDLHDNCSIFDLLVPELQHKNGLDIVALDLPGHGHSHGLPLGSIYLDTTVVNEIRRFVKYIGWHQGDHEQKMPSADDIDQTSSMENQENQATSIAKDRFTIVGHGEGAGLALFYARLFPEDVGQIISLDFVKLAKIDSNDLLRYTANKVEQIVNIKMTLAQKNKLQSQQLSLGQDSNSNYKSISYKDCLKLMSNNCSAPGELNDDEVSTLVKRSIQSESKLSDDCTTTIKEDSRLINYIATRVYGELSPGNAADGLQCHLSVLLARNGRHKDGNDLDDLEIVLEEYKKVCTSFELSWMEDADHFFLIKRVRETADWINQALRI